MRKVDVAQEQVVSRDRCVHWWVIEPPAAETSQGTCKRCGAEKVFSNVWRANGRVLPT